MDVDTRDLELLEALERTGTLTAAAEALFVSQPALSQRLSRLDQQVGAPLYDRRGRRLVATQVGRRMQQLARVVLTQLRTAEEDIRELVEGDRRPLLLMSQCTTNYEWLMPVLSRFRERRPGVDVRIDQLDDDHRDPIQAVLDGRLDLALVTKLDRRTDEVRLHRLFDDEMRAVMAVDHPLAGRHHLDGQDLASAHLVLYDSYDPRRSSPIPLPIPPDMRPGRVTTLPVSTDVLIDMVASSQDISVLPSWIIAPYLASHGVTTVQIGQRPQRRTWYGATRHHDRTDATDDLLLVLEESFASYPDGLVTSGAVRQVITPGHATV